MRKVQHPREVEIPTRLPGARKPSARAKDISEREFIPKLSVLIVDIGERGPNRSAALRDLRKFASKYGMEELWGAADALIAVIKNKKEASFDRIDAVDTIVSVLNAVRGKIVKKERGGITWSAESQVHVQGALPRVHSGAIIDAAEAEIAAEKKRFDRMEIVGEESTIGLLNSIALSEMFDNTDVAKAIRNGILKLESPHAKKLMNGIVLGETVDALEAKPKVVADEDSAAPAKPTGKVSLERLFHMAEDETDFSDVG